MEKTIKLTLEERKKIYEKEFNSGVAVPNDVWLESKLKTRGIPTEIIVPVSENEQVRSSLEKGNQNECKK